MEFLVALFRDRLISGCNLYYLPSQFNPELIIVSAGYDAALGCPEVMSESKYLMLCT